MRMNKALTINDIARLAGVAKSTVSRYLNNGKVSEETKGKIRSVIEQYNYEPNAFAQSLKAKKTKFVGIIAPGLDSLVTSKVIMAIDITLRENGYNPLIINTSLRGDLEIESIENLIRLKVDGIILVATQIKEEHREMIHQINIPFVMVGQASEGIISIVNDDYQAGFEMGTYIREMGHKHVIYLGVADDDVSVGIKRRRGVIDGLKHHDDSATIKVLISDFTSELSEKVIGEALDIYQVTAIICATDRMALGARKAILNHNLSVPQDISLAGFGGYDLANLVTPPLTTIKFENEKTGQIAAQTIIDLIAEKEVSELQTIGYEFIKSESVKKDN